MKRDGMVATKKRRGFCPSSLYSMDFKKKLFLVAVLLAIAFLCLVASFLAVLLGAIFFAIAAFSFVASLLAIFLAFFLAIFLAVLLAFFLVLLVATFGFFLLATFFLLRFLRVHADAENCHGGKHH